MQMVCGDGRCGKRPRTTLEHDPEKWGTGFPKRSCSNKKIERDDDSKKSHPALGTIASDCLRERRSGLANTRGSIPMIASEILAKGVEQGIISAEQAARLRALEDVREPPESPASPDDEQLRFIGGFSDIFVTIGLAMFLGAIGYFAGASGGGPGLGIVIAATAWLLAEFFTRGPRKALPNIRLLIVIACPGFIAPRFS